MKLLKNGLTPVTKSRFSKVVPATSSQIKTKNEQEFDFQVRKVAGRNQFTWEQSSPDNRKHTYQTLNPFSNPTLTKTNADEPQILSKIDNTSKTANNKTEKDQINHDLNIDKLYRDPKMKLDKRKMQ